MLGGIAIAGNLLCLAHAQARGQVFLVDLDERRLASLWEYGVDGNGGFADAGGVAMGRDFTIWVADTRNDIVRCFSAFGREVARLGRPAEVGPGSVRRDRRGVLDRPHAVAVHRDTVWVACGERRLVRGVQRFARDGSCLPPLRAFGDPEARFGAPRGVFADDQGVLVADTLHGCVQRFATDGAFIGQFTVALAPNESSRPVAALRLPDGSVLVADQGDRKELKRFGPGGEPRPWPDLTNELHEPVGLALDAQRRLYVLDRDGQRVQRLTLDGRLEAAVFDLSEVLHDG